MVLYRSFQKTKYYDNREGRQPICFFICIFNVPNIHDEVAYIYFIENTQLNTQLPQPENEPGLLEFVNTYLVHFLSRTLYKHNNNECIFSYGRFFTLKITTKPIETGKDINHKNLNVEKDVVEKGQKLY